MTLDRFQYTMADLEGPQDTEVLERIEDELGETKLDLERNDHDNS
jgi:hypothetical protein